MKKRMYCIVLVIILLFGNILTAEAKYYDDVDVETLGVEYRDAVNYMSDNGYMVGTTATTFLPYDKMTRAMVVTVLYSMEGKPVCDIELEFKDVPSGAWYYNAVRWAYANKIVGGKTSETFDPNGKITRAEFALVLRAYAHLHDYSIETTNEIDIAKAQDYSLIPSYARTAMQWMADKRIYRVDTTSAMLNPNSSMERKDVALCIVRYGEYVEGLDFNKDTLPFINSRKYFTNENITNRYIAEEDWDALVDKVKMRYPDNPDDVIETLADYRDGRWGGSCNGMSMVVVLDKIGKIGFNENLSEPVSSMSKVTEPISQLEVLSKINYYQVAQLIPEIYDKPFQYAGDRLYEGYAKLVEEVKNNGIVQLGYFYPSGGHSIVVYQCTTNSNEDYVLWAYDPNSRNVRQCIIDGEYKWSTFDDLKVKRISFRSDFSVYDNYDYDGSYNVEEAESIAIIEVPLCQGDLVITNEIGQKLCYDSEAMDFTGDLEVIYSQFTTDILMIYVENSESFMVEIDNDICDISLLGADVYVDVEGTDIEKIVMESDGRVQLEGENMNYSVVAKQHGNNSERVEVSDTASGIVTIDGNN